MKIVAATVFAGTRRAFTPVFAGYVVLIELHGTGGQVIALNPKTVVSMRAPRHGDHFGPGTKCFISTLDGKFVAVTDPCAAVRELMPK